MRSIFLIIICLSFLGCQPQYRMNQDFLNSSKPIEGFIIEKIVVDSVYNEDRERKLYQDSTGKFRSKPEHKKGYPVSFSGGDTAVMLIKDTGNYPDLKKIYFDKENQGYYWRYWKEPSSSGKFKAMPMRFLPGEWYHIPNLSGKHGDYSYHIYIHVQEDGSLETYHDYKPGPY